VSLDNDIWLADAVRSVAILRPRDPDATFAILRTLGLHLTTGEGGGRPPEATARDTAQPGGENGEVGLEVESGELPGPEAGTGEVDLEAGTGELPANELLETLEPIAVETGGGVEGWRSARPLDPVTVQHLQGVREHEPLLAPGRAGPILAAAVETRDLNGPVDVDRLVGTVARARPVQRLPRLALASLARGVQLLVDTGLGMEPFARDQQELAIELRRVVGRSGVTELHFRNCPTRGAGTGPLWTWRDYRPPAPGTPVLVLTDLGIGGPRISLQRSQAWEWRALATLLARRASPLVAFVPYPASRFPSGLAKSMTIVPWDRTTTISTVRSLDATGYGSGS
jgi:hypothetical protein